MEALWRERLAGEREEEKEEAENERRLLQILLRVCIVHIIPRHIKLKLGSKVLEVLVERQIPPHLDSAGNARLVRPGSRDVSDGVTPATEDDQGDVEGSHEGDAGGVSCEERRR